jgi:DNA-3-methyladenine glycosylase I
MLEMPDQPLPGDGLPRCEWALGGGPLYLRYHDLDWGVPVRDERLLFELLVLEGAQAGLSWLTILRKRDTYRAAFGGFVPETVAAFDEADVARLMADPGIVRNRLKVAAAIANARAVVVLQAGGSSLVEHLWSFVDGKPVVNRWRSLEEIPSATATSQAMSRDLRRRGFRFVGPTICYALMQSAGLVNDHETTCHRWRDVQASIEAGTNPRDLSGPRPARRP